MILFNNTPNIYLRTIYFDSLCCYRPDICVEPALMTLQEYRSDPAWTKGEHSLQAVTDVLKKYRNETILIDAESLTPEMIVLLKENQNRIVAFDINDNSVFCYSYSDSPAILDVDMIFKVAGIQKTNHSYETMIDENCEYGLISKRFMSPVNWVYYRSLKEENRIHPLPYVLWENYNVPNTPYSHRSPLVLVRGGHHYNRVHLLFNLMKFNLVDSNSVFNTRGYIGQYCDVCRDTFLNGRMTYDSVVSHPSSCRLVRPFPMEYFQSRGDWNNSCPSRYFEMAEIMGLDRGRVEDALNGSYVGITDYYDILNKYLMYADLKWIFSIYAPPRFWEAAAAHTINLVPIRTNDQDYFPEMIDQEHYLTFSEDFEDLDLVSEVYEKSYQRIVDNTYDLYDRWIKSGQYMLSTNLMDHIMSKIEGL
jgi:hypothetical protein